MSVRRDRIIQKLEQVFSPMHLGVEDESKNHSVPDGAESHFRCEIVSEKFEGQGRIERHRLVNEALDQEFHGGLHALSLHLYTVKEWESANPAASPSCAGASKTKS